MAENIISIHFKTKVDDIVSNLPPYASKGDKIAEVSKKFRLNKYEINILLENTKKIKNR